MEELLTPDLCVIGAGAGGLSVAAAAAQFGLSVALIERGAMGGDCLNTGCVPSKALLAAARHAYALRHADRFGIRAAHPTVDFRAVQAHVMGVIGAIAPNDSAERFGGLGVRVLAGNARFTDSRTVAVDDDYAIRARRFVIAAGSMPAVPDIPGLAEVPYLTNETVFELRRCPGRLIVIGGGPIGLELAQAHRRLGAEVTVLEAAAPLARDDPECAAIVLDQLAREGVVVRAHTRICRVERSRARIRVLVRTADGAEETLEGSHLLIAAGRRPDVEALQLEAAGIACDEGGILVDKRLRTSNRRVYAVGDVVKGAPRFTHVANHHASLVIRNAVFRLPVNVHKATIPWVTYTDPELAQVGLQEAQARERHGAIRVLRWPYHDTDRAVAERQTAGHVKLIASRRGRILGVTIVGAHAGELISTWTLAVSRKMHVGALLGLIMPYPILGEAGKRAAVSYYAPALTRPWLRRIIRLLRGFG